MKLLVIGSGGREHALAWKLAQSPRVAEVIVAPGNAGTAREHKCSNAPIAATDIEGLLNFVEAEGIDLTIVGREAPLVLGVVNAFRAAGQRIFGPRSTPRSWKAAGLRQGFPAPARHPDRLLPGVRGRRTGAGPRSRHRRAGRGQGRRPGRRQGRIVAMKLHEAEDAILDMLSGNVFGSAGSRVVIEEFLEGEEASFITLVDGKTALPMATSQDHKRVHDGDCGPNTGGMGAYSPAPVVTPEVHARVMREIIEPTVRGMADDGHVFTGFPLRRPDDRCQRRAESHRVQRALRRPGNSAGDDAIAVRPA